MLMRNAVKYTIMKRIIPILFLLTGCLTKEKALRKLDKDLAQICAEKFPVKDSTIYIAGDTINTVEFFEHSDTVNVVKYDTVFNTVTNTVTKIKTQRIVDTLRLVRENTARVAALQTELATMQAKLNESIATAENWENKARTRLTWLLVICFFIGLYTVLKIMRK